MWAHLSLEEDLSSSIYEVYSKGSIVSHRESSKGFPVMLNEDSPSSETKESESGSSTDRRKRAIPIAVERRSGKDRRDKEKRPDDRGERRRQVDPTTCEKDYSDEEIDFMKAMDLYKRSNRRPFPTWSEVLEVLRSMGYRKTETAVALPGLPVMAKREE